MLAASLGLAWGLGGLWILGQALFFGIGAYAYALLSVDLGWDVLPSILAAITIAMLAATVMAVAIMPRAKDAALALVTLAVVFIAEQGAQSLGFTGGFNGVLGVPPVEVAGIDTADPATLQILSACLLLAAYAATQLLARTAFGAVLTACRDDEVRTSHFGFHVNAYRGTALAISAGMAALAGVLVAGFEGAVFPDSMSLAISLQAVVWLLVGGHRSVGGAIQAALLLLVLEELLGDATTGRWLLIQGVILVLVATWAPGGLAGSIDAAASRMRSALSGTTRRSRRAGVM